MKKSSNSRRRAVAATPTPSENFTTEKTAVQEKIIVGNKPIKRVIRRAPIRRVIKAESSVQQVEAKAAPKVELPTVPVPPVEKITPPPASATSLKSAVSRKIVAPPVAKAVVPDPQLAEKAAAEKAAAEKAAAEKAAAEKAAAEKAAAEKAAAEKAAAEKAAAEKAAAEKAAAEKAAAEKAAAEKAAAEKAAAEKAAAIIPVADDLKKIEGIGPKLSKVLNNAGIINFKQLADKSNSELQDILDEAGPRYRIARPKSWPLQAAMAAAGEWDKLKAFQTEMRGGILPD